MALHNSKLIFYIMIGFAMVSIKSWYIHNSQSWYIHNEQCALNFISVGKTELYLNTYLSIKHIRESKGKLYFI